MKKMLFDVLTVDSDSEEDEVEILSENIPNYGNVPVPVKITPQIRAKVRSSLEKCGNFKGKIGVMKIYASKNNNNSVGTVRATMVPASGHGAQIINLGPASTFFPSQVKDMPINNSRKRKSPSYPLATDSKKVISEKRFRHSLADGPKESQTLNPPVTSNNIIPPSHIRSKHRAQSIKSNPSVETSRIRANDDSCLVSSPSTEDSSHDLTPLWFNDLSFHDEIGLNESSTAQRILNKVEKNSCFNSMQTLTPQNKTSNEYKHSTPKNISECFGSERSGSQEVEVVVKSGLKGASRETNSPSGYKQNSMKDIKNGPKEANLPPLPTRKSSDNPIKPPTEAGESDISLWELNYVEFLAVTGLCEDEENGQIGKRGKVPKSGKRVLRKRHKK